MPGNNAAIFSPGIELGVSPRSTEVARKNKNSGALCPPPPLPPENFQVTHLNVHPPPTLRSP